MISMVKIVIWCGEFWGVCLMVIFWLLKLVNVVISEVSLMRENVVILGRFGMCMFLWIGVLSSNVVNCKLYC